MTINPDGLTEAGMVLAGGGLMFAIVGLIMKAKSDKIGRELAAYYAQKEAEKAWIALPVNERTDPAP